MTTPKHKELTVQIVATLKVGYNDSELKEMGKDFREFKHGVERLVRSELLPAFQADEHSTVEVMTVGFPTKRRFKEKSKNQHKLRT